MNDADLIREWNERLSKEGLSVNSGSHEWLRYSHDPETFSPKSQRLERRIQPRTAKLCVRCGEKFFGRPNQKFHSRACKENFRKFGAKLPPNSAREK